MSAGTANRYQRAAAMALSSGAVIASLVAAPGAQAAPTHETGDTSVGAQKIVGKHKWGKWTKAGFGQVKCRFYIALSVSKKTASAAGRGHCKREQAQVVVAAITVNNQKIKHTVKRGGFWGHKDVYTKAVKAKNRKGKQTFCAFGWVNHPMDELNVKRSSAKVCIKR
ncbi:hypothetical protein OG863_00245 [Streptomyces decoyicus]|uniref:Uncharacterized protein n=1 Tax=Streptomyces decoyicus TaxID=249567 RepID=A0ABZ1F8I2_9ACTN|nr:hypothetical protein [Streptomyces decoyicus]WSB66545.1 hypothetical protein OG863_00245 [Streptomyces decoyicus]